MGIFIKQSVSTWDKQFKSGKWEYTRELQNKKVIAEIINTYQVSSVLDIGCGLGSLCGEISPSVSYTGIDISSVAIEECKKVYPKGDFFVSTLENFSTRANQVYDVLVFQEVLYYMNWLYTPLYIKRYNPRYIVISLYKSKKLKIRFLFWCIERYFTLWYRVESRRTVTHGERSMDIIVLRRGGAHRT